MPFTFNGIGTGYYGRTNVSARNGRCEFCNRDTTLTSYDTREWFCVIFIPLIPLTRYRIMEQCASCRRHRRLPQQQFRQQLDEQIAPLRAAIQSSPSDAIAHEKLVRALIGFRMLNEAETAGRAACSALPQNAILNRITGDILTAKGDLGGAAAFLRRATNLDPADQGARASLGNVLYLQRNFAEAARQLEEARRLAPDDVASGYTLGDCYVQLQRWNEALAVFQAIGGPTPQKLVLRRIAECKKQLGYELTPAERSAARRWWPFGRRGPKAVKLATAKSGSELRPKVVFGLLAAVAVIAIGGALTWGFYKSHHVDVYFDSAIPGATFNVDGATFTPNPPPAHRTLSPGRHHVVVTGRDGKTIETRDVDVEGGNVASSIFTGRAYVYNTAALRVYKRAAIDYAANERDAGYNEQLVALQPFFEIDHLDYIFEMPPQTVELSSGQSKTTKHAFLMSQLTLLQYARLRAEEQNFAEAAKALRVVNGFEPCNVDAREMLVAIRGMQKATGDAVAIAKAGIGACGADPVPSHRLYQDTKRRFGLDDEVIAEYRAALDGHANSAMHHYLYGRLLKDPHAAMGEERIAVSLDPKFGWAHAALGYGLTLEGAYAESMDEYGAALATRQHDDATLLYYTFAAIGAGRLQDAHAVVDPATAKIETQSAWYSKWLLAIAEKKLVAAKQMYDSAAKDGLSPEVWLLGAQLFKAGGDTEAYAKHLAAADKHKELRPVAARMRFYDAMEQGAWPAAVQQLDAMPGHENAYLLRFYAAAATMLNGDAREAAAQMAAVTKAMDEDKDLDPISRRMLTSLGSALTTGDEAAVLAATHDDVTEMNDACFFLGARAMARGDRKHAKELFQRSAASSFDLSFPMAAAQRLASL